MLTCKSAAAAGISGLDPIVAPPYYSFPFPIGEMFTPCDNVSYNYFAVFYFADQLEAKVFLIGVILRRLDHRSKVPQPCPEEVSRKETDG